MNISMNIAREVRRIKNVSNGSDMNREEIEKKAKQLYFEQALMPIQLGVAIAEWMQEQKQAEIAELTNLVSARDGMIEQMAERIEELDDKVSELTEALDASHVFCEGVKDAIVNKAVKFLAEMGFTHIKEFKEAMKVNSIGR